MWSLPKGNQFLPEVSLQKLTALYLAEKNAKAKLRFLVAIRRKKGDSIDAIASTVEKPRRTVHGWLHRFEKYGLERAHDIKQSGRPAELTLRKRQSLIKDLERGPPHNRSGLWSTKSVRELIAKRYKRRYVKQHVWRLLVSLGFSLQRPRKRHYKRPSDQELWQFKKKLGEKHNIIERKDLLWARKMKPRSVSFPSLRAAGRAKEADQSSS